MSAHRGPWRQGRFDLQGHRGAQGHVVENTYASFAKAVALGATTVELDVYLTADGVPVIWHDAALDPPQCSSVDPALIGARIPDLTRTQLDQVDIGTWTNPEFPGQVAVPGQRILSLSDMFERLHALAPDLWFNVEVKCDPTRADEAARREELVRAVLATITACGVRERAIVHSFDWEVLRIAQRLDPDLPRSALAMVGETWAPGSQWVGPRMYDEHAGDLAAAAKAVGADVVAPLFAQRDFEGATPDPDRLVTDRAFVEHAHDLGIAVVPWTVNEPSDLAAVIAAGVDGLVTDYPDRVQVRDVPLW